MARRRSSHLCAPRWFVGGVGGQEGWEVRKGGRVRKLPSHLPSSTPRSSRPPAVSVLRSPMFVGGVGGQEGWEVRKGGRSGRVGGQEGWEVRKGGRSGSFPPISHLPSPIPSLQPRPLAVSSAPRWFCGGSGRSGSFPPIPSLQPATCGVRLALPPQRGTLTLTVAGRRRGGGLC